MKKDMLINVLQPEEIRIAILEDGVLEELYVERTSHESYVGNIYKGRIVNIEPSIQAAFVDFGVGRNGFLHVSDVEPAYYRHLENFSERRSPRDKHRGPGRDRRPQPMHDYDEGPPSVVNLPEEDYEDLVLETPLIADHGMEEVRQPEGSALDRDWDEDPDQPDEGNGREAWQRSEEAIEEAEEALEVELPTPQSPHATDRNSPSSQEMGRLEEVPDIHDDDDGEATEVEVTEVTALENQGTESVESEEDAPSDEAAAEEEKPSKGRGRRPRGRGGRGRGRGKGRSSEAKGEGKDESKKRREGGSRPMGSAEHRTDPDESRHFQPLGDISDDDLSFSRVRRTPAEMSPPPAGRSEPEPMSEVETHTVEDDDRQEDGIQSIDDLAHDVHEVEVQDVTAREQGFRESDDRTRPEDQETDAVVNEDPDAEIIEEERVHIEEFDTTGVAPALEEDYPAYEEEPRRSGGREGGRDGGRGRDRGNRERGERDRGERERGDRDRGSRDRGGRDRDRNDRGDRGERGERGDRGDRSGRGRGDRRGGPNRRGPGGRPGMGRPKPLIQDIFKRGQEVLVQVIKEGLGTKGPTLSTYISIAGRYLVLMPGLNRIGVSRKILDDDARYRLRDTMSQLNPPKGLGFIIRTAGQDRDKKELQRDLMYLARLWKVVARRIKKQKSPCEVYQESDMVTRTIRDIFTSDIENIYVDERSAYESAREFLDVVMPKYAERIKFYDSPEPMFHKYGIEQEITRIQQRRIELPAGGSIVIDQTEALVAIDVNSGSFRADNNAEETAYRMNLQAAKEIARQLRLRDLGGVIVNDFIDMREDRHRRNVERALRDAVRRDRARTKILRISQFGMIEMTRQRIRPSLKRSVFHECSHCKGTGQAKTIESMSIDVMRMLQLAVHRDYIQRLEIRVQDEVANYLLNRKRTELSRLEEASGKAIVVRGQLAVSPEFLEFLCYDHNAHEVKFDPFEEPHRPGSGPGRRRGR